MSMSYMCSPSPAHRQSLLSSLKTTECHSTFQSTLSRHQSSCAWQCRSVIGSQVRDTRDPSPAASRCFPMVLGYTAGATCDRISYLDVATAACTMHMYYVATGNLVYGCGKFPQTTESSNTPPIHCIQHVQ